MTDQQIGFSLLCGLCCIWPLVWACGAWWLRGRVTSGESLLDSLKNRLPVKPEKEL